MPGPQNAQKDQQDPGQKKRQTLMGGKSASVHNSLPPCCILYFIRYFYHSLRKMARGKDIFSAFFHGAEAKRKRTVSGEDGPLVLMVAKLRSINIRNLAFTLKPEYKSCLAVDFQCNA